VGVEDEGSAGSVEPLVAGLELDEDDAELDEPEGGVLPEAGGGGGGAGVVGVVELGESGLLTVTTTMLPSGWVPAPLATVTSVDGWIAGATVAAVVPSPPAALGPPA
jgi:hypothetical protein